MALWFVSHLDSAIFGTSTHNKEHNESEHDAHSVDDMEISITYYVPFSFYYAIYVYYYLSSILND